jgi:hypothetical protein
MLLVFLPRLECLETLEVQLCRLNLVRLEIRLNLEYQQHLQYLYLLECLETLEVQLYRLNLVRLETLLGQYHLINLEVL